MKMCHFEVFEVNFEKSGVDFCVNLRARKNRHHHKYLPQPTRRVPQRSFEVIVLTFSVPPKSGGANRLQIQRKEIEQACHLI